MELVHRDSQEILGLVKDVRECASLAWRQLGSERVQVGCNHPEGRLHYVAWCAHEMERA